jgi:hypothetical protein
MMQTIHPKVLTNAQHEEIANVTDKMLLLGNAYEKAIATAYISLEGDCISQRKLANDLSHRFLSWIEGF